MGLVGASEKLAIPNEPDEWIVVRGLGWDERKVAKREAFKAAVADMTDMAEAMAELNRIRGEQPETPDGNDTPTREAVLAGFHWPTVLDAGLVDWSYDARTAEGRPDWSRADNRLLEYCVASVLEASGYDVPGGERPMGNSSAPSTGP